MLMLIGSIAWGRRWLRTGDGFGALFSLLAAMAPIRRDAEGSYRLRVPFAGLSELAVLPGTAALILITLGATSFDGLSRTRFWADVVENQSGWSATWTQTIGMAWMIGIVWLAYSGASRISAYVTGDSHVVVERTYVHALIPIMLAYAVAHYFSLFVFEGQGFLALLSDPAAQGWDLFGTAANTINFLFVSPTTIAWVQALSIVVGHIVAVVVAHDRAVELHDTRSAVKSQWPFVAVMVLYTVGGLLLLVGL
jgi:hypothetical protein